MMPKPGITVAAVEGVRRDLGVAEGAGELDLRAAVGLDRRVGELRDGDLRAGARDVRARRRAPRRPAPRAASAAAAARAARRARRTACRAARRCAARALRARSPRSARAVVRVRLAAQLVDLRAQDVDAGRAADALLQRAPRRAVAAGRRGRRRRVRTDFALLHHVVPCRGDVARRAAARRGAGRRAPTPTWRFASCACDLRQRARVEVLGRADLRDVLREHLRLREAELRERAGGVAVRLRDLVLQACRRASETRRRGRARTSPRSARPFARRFSTVGSWSSA